ncbi:hypothetical protein DAI22_09g179750 [Oryza sativa Japonica Group]|nr:hypothetical protein DAI22_09g179750 [Oryza sativa Japonica Group]
MENEINNLYKRGVLFFLPTYCYIIQARTPILGKFQSIAWSIS